MNFKNSLFAIATLFVLGGCQMLSQNVTASSEKDLDSNALDMYMTDVDEPDVSVTVSQAGSGLVGEWTAEIDLKEEMEKEKLKSREPKGEFDQAGEDFAMAMAEAMSSMFKADLSLNEDGTFKMTLMMMPVEGKWTRTGNKLTLNAESFMGMKQEDFEKFQSEHNQSSQSMSNEPMNLIISKDGKSLTMESDEKDSTGFVFVRKS